MLLCSIENKMAINVKKCDLKSSSPKINPLSIMTGINLQKVISIKDLVMPFNSNKTFNNHIRTIV